MKGGIIINNNIIFLIQKAYKNDKVLIFFAILNSFLQAILSIILILYPRAIILSLQNQSDVKDLMQNISIITIVLLISGFISSILDGKISNKLIKLRNFFIEDYMSKCMSMPYDLTENPTSLDKINHSFSAINNNTDGVEGVYNTLCLLSKNIITIIFYSMILIPLSPIVFIGLFILFIIVTIISIKFKENQFKLEKHRIPYVRFLSKIEELMTDFVYGKEIRLFQLSSLFNLKYENEFYKIMKCDEEVEKEKLKLSFVFNLFTLIFNFILISITLNKTISGNLSIADFVVFIGVSIAFSTNSMLIIENISIIKKQDKTISVFRDFVYSNECNDLNINKTKVDFTNEFHIEFKNVEFSYPNSNIIIYENLNFTISKGEKVALVGNNGAGKTTLIKLLFGFYFPTKGQILINGIDIKEIDLISYRENLSPIFQKSMMLYFSLKDNIDFNKSDKNCDWFNQISNKSGLCDIIEKFPKGEYSAISKNFDVDGIELSGGQQQILMLARAMYKDGSFFLFDEPTASLDSIAESQIYENFSTITENKTVLYVSHRLSSTKFCDKILFLNNKKIEAIGSHYELLKTSINYKNMYDKQAVYYKV